MTFLSIIRAARRHRMALAPSFSLAMIAASPLHGQATCTALRTNQLSTFVTTSSVTPDFFPGHAMGITAGVDWTVHHGRYLATSLEVRGNRSLNDQLIERSVTFGPLIQTNIGTKVHPYINYFIGGGTIVFLNHSTGYHEDRGPVHSLGGGATIDLPRGFSTRMDFQSQSWNLGRDQSNGPLITFSPTLVSLGVQYTVPFRPRLSRVH